MSAPELVDGTDVSIEDLALIGLTLLNLAGATRLMRHATPAGTVDYVQPSTGAQMLVNDFAKWCGGNCPDAGDRLVAFLEGVGWQNHLGVDFIPAGDVAA